MWKKLSLGAFALLLALLANTHLYCRVSVNGETVEGRFSPWQHDGGLLAAASAAEEILPGQTVLPKLSTRLGLSLRPPEGSAAQLSDAVLRETAGVELLDGVFVNSVPLGCVEDGDVLKAELRAYLTITMPNSAVSGTYSEELALRHVYTRAGAAVSYDDMVQLVSGMAPVLFTDADGRRIMG